MFNYLVFTIGQWNGIPVFLKQALNIPKFTPIYSRSSTLFGKFKRISNPNDDFMLRI